jgi:esterase/lipase superfamily enzyme
VLRGAGLTGSIFSSGEYGTRGSTSRHRSSRRRAACAQLPPEILAKMYLFVSADDRALRISRRITGDVPRVGASNATVLEELGLTVIDLSEIEDSSSGSPSKFAGSPELVRLIGAGLDSAGRFAEGPNRILGN